MKKIAIILLIVAAICFCFFLFARYKSNEAQKHIDEANAKIEALKSSQDKSSNND